MGRSSSGNPADDWLGLRRDRIEPGSRFASFGIEIDHTSAASPRGTRVFAEIPNLLGPGMTAQMTYYETRKGAKVFATGAFTLGGAALWPAASRVLENLWARLADDAFRSRSPRPVPAGSGRGALGGLEVKRSLLYLGHGVHGRRVARRSDRARRPARARR